MLNSQSVHQVARNTSGCEAKQENNEQMKVKASFVCMQKKKKKGVSLENLVLIGSCKK